MKTRRLLLCAILVVTAMLITTTIHATTLPWLDFGSNLIWDSNTNTLTNHASTYVNSVTYRNGATYPTIPISFPLSDGVIFSPVSMSISFDGNNTNDFINIGSWLSASLNVTGPTPNPLTPNQFIVNVSSAGMNVNTGAGSPWADEFDSTIDYSLLYPARLIINPFGSYIPLGGGRYKVNAPGKLAPVPEPGTLLLLGSGLMGVAFYRKRKK